MDPQRLFQEPPAKSNFLAAGCGRDDRVKEIWGDEAGGLSKHSE